MEEDRKEFYVLVVFIFIVNEVNNTKYKTTSTSTVLYLYQNSIPYIFYLKSLPTLECGCVCVLVSNSGGWAVVGKWGCEGAGYGTLVSPDNLTLTSTAGPVLTASSRPRNFR